MRNSPLRRPLCDDHRKPRPVQRKFTSHPQPLSIRMHKTHLHGRNRQRPPPSKAARVCNRPTGRQAQSQIGRTAEASLGSHTQKRSILTRTHNILTRWRQTCTTHNLCVTKKGCTCPQKDHRQAPLSTVDGSSYCIDGRCIHAHHWGQRSTGHHFRLNSHRSRERNTTDHITDTNQCHN